MHVDNSCRDEDERRLRYVEALPKASVWTHPSTGRYARCPRGCLQQQSDHSVQRLPELHTARGDCLCCPEVYKYMSTWFKKCHNVQPYTPNYFFNHCGIFWWLQLTISRQSYFSQRCFFAGPSIESFTVAFASTCIQTSCLLPIQISILNSKTIST